MILLNLGNLNGRLTLDFSGFTRGIRSALSSVKQFGNALNGSFGAGPQGSIRNTQASVDALGASFKDLGRIVSGIVISQMFYGAVTSIKEATSAVIEFKGEMEKAQIGMEYFLGNSDAAKGFIMNMKDFAADTAFNTTQALTLSRRLLGAQFQPENIRDVMSILNDSSAATGATAQNMDRIVLAMTQMKTNGRIMGGELRQFAEAGIPVYQILREELKLTSDQMARIGDLRISGDTGVAAILSGLQKRYEGAADRIADTLPGMLETIRDNLLMLSETIIDKPYRAWEKFITKVRDGLDTLRGIQTEKGLGGVFEAIVPPELQQSVRNIIASIQSLADSFKILFNAVRPIAGTLFTQVIVALGKVTPAIAAFVRSMTMVVAGIIQANPWIKAFIGTIMGILVANIAAKSLMFLWSVMRLGFIATAVGQAVLYLARAIQFLTVALAKNGITRLLMILAAVLTYVAFSSKSASAWLASVEARLASLAGIDTSTLLQPEDNKSLDEWTKNFNKELDKMTDGFKTAGKEGKKAGKTIKDKFVASFDELYQVPEELDKIGSGMDDLADDMPNLEMPDFDIETPGMPDDPLKGGLDIDDLPGFPMPAKPPVQGPKEPPKGNGGGSDPFPWDPVAVTDKVTTINNELAKMRAGLAATALAFGTFALNSLEAMTNMAASMIPVFTGIGAQFGSLAVSIGSVGLAITNTISSLPGVFGSIFNSLGLTVTEFVGKLALIGTTITTLTSPITLMNGLIVTLADSFSRLSNVITTTSPVAQGWGQVVTMAQIPMKAWNSSLDYATNTALPNLSNGLTSLGTTFTTWGATAKQAVTDMAKNVTGNIAAMGESISTSIINAMNSSGKAFAEWGNNVSLNVHTMVNNTSANIEKWTDNVRTNIGTALSDTSTGIADWVNETSGNFAKWADNVSLTVADVANNVSLNLVKMGQSGWESFKGLLEGTAKNAVTWANAVSSTINDFAKNFVDAMVAVASAIGAKLVSAYNGVKLGLSDGYSTEGSPNTTANTVAGVTAGVVSVTGAAAAWLKSAGSVAGKAAGSFFGPLDLMVEDFYNSMVKGDSLPAFATGGIIGKDMVARIGEGNKKEAIIPLEASQHMAPFSNAVANDLISAFSEAGMFDTRGGGGNSENPQIYIWNYIGDDRSLKELQRRFEVIKIEEDTRRGIGGNSL